MLSGRFWRSVAGAIITLVAIPSAVATNAPELRAAPGGGSIAAAHSNNVGLSAASNNAVGELPSLDDAVTSTAPPSETTQPTNSTVPDSTTSSAPAVTVPTNATTVAADPDANESLLVPLAVPSRGHSDPLAPLGRIKIAAIGLDATLREGVAQNVINAGPAHWPGTAAPGGVGNAVIAGHRSTYSQPFHDVANLVVGDAIVLETTSGWRHTYHVERQFVVGSDAMWITDQGVGRHVTLFTCHPIGSSRQRLITVGVLVKSERLV